MEQKKKKKRRLKTGVFNFLIVLILLAGMGLILYPSFSDWYNSLHQSRVVMEYNEIVENNDEEKNSKLFQEARNYNNELASADTDFVLSDEEKARYNSILDVSGTGVMGYVKIDKIKVNLPIYHDTSEGVLQVAVGHLAGSSLPVGGNSSHCVITGHTGLPSARLFTDIDQLEDGDIFEIVVLGHTLTYEVDDIRVVLPDELESLKVEHGKDLVTLVTCTPYGINTHRLLVTGHRIPNLPGKTSVQKDEEANNNRLILIGVAGILIALIFSLLIILLLKRRHIRKSVSSDN